MRIIRREIVGGFGGVRNTFLERAIPAYNNHLLQSYKYPLEHDYADRVDICNYSPESVVISNTLLVKNQLQFGQLGPFQIFLQPGIHFSVHLVGEIDFPVTDASWN